MTIKIEPVNTKPNVLHPGVSAQDTHAVTQVSNQQDKFTQNSDKEPPKLQVYEPQVRNEMTDEELNELLRKINLSFDIFEIQSRFIVDPTGQEEIKVEIRNTVTGELIRKIPMAEIQDLYQEFKTSVGSIINKLL